MENKVKSLLIKTGIAILASIILIIAAWFLIKIFNEPSGNSNISSQSIEIKQNVYEKLTSPQDYGGNVSTGDSGFGRVNPFAPYK